MEIGETLKDKILSRGTDEKLSKLMNDEVFMNLAQANGSSAVEIALSTNIPPSMVASRLNTMIEQGFVQRDDEEVKNLGTHFAFYSLTPDGFEKAQTIKSKGKTMWI